MSRGLIGSIMWVVICGLVGAFMRFSVNEWAVSPYLFVCMGLFVAAVTLIVLAGPGPLGVATLRQPHTWLYSFFEVLLNVLAALALLFITATESNLLGRSSILLALVMAWAFFGRKPYKTDIIGTLIIVAGLALVMGTIPENVRGPAIALTLGVAICQTIRAAIAELHPTSNLADTVKDRCRCTGYVLYVTSIMFLLFAVAGGILKHLLPLDQQATLPMVQQMPSLLDFLDTHTLLAALLLGMFMMAPLMYFYFYANRYAKSETFLMVMSLLPFSTLLFEWAFAQFGLLDLGQIEPRTLIAAVIVSGGAMFMVWMRYRGAHIRKK